MRYIKIYDKIEKHLPELMSDQYANYFVQKLFSILNPGMRARLLMNIKDSLCVIGKDKTGTYALQTIIESLRNNEEKKIIIQGTSFKDFYEMCLVIS